MEKELTGNFIIDINTFSTMSIDVGYQNHKMNQKDEDDNYNKDECDKYEQMRLAQLNFLEKLIKEYHKE